MIELDSAVNGNSALLSRRHGNVGQCLELRQRLPLVPVKVISFYVVASCCLKEFQIDFFQIDFDFFPTFSLPVSMLPLTCSICDVIEQIALLVDKSAASSRRLLQLQLPCDTPCCDIIDAALRVLHADHCTVSNNTSSLALVDHSRQGDCSVNYYTLFNCA